MYILFVLLAGAGPEVSLHKKAQTPPYILPGLQQPQYIYG